MGSSTRTTSTKLSGTGRRQSSNSRHSLGSRADSNSQATTSDDKRRERRVRLGALVVDSCLDNARQLAHGVGRTLHHWTRDDPAALRFAVSTLAAEGTPLGVEEFSDEIGVRRPCRGHLDVPVAWEPEVLDGGTRPVDLRIKPLVATHPTNAKDAASAVPGLHIGRQWEQLFDQSFRTRGCAAPKLANPFKAGAEPVQQPVDPTAEVESVE